MERDQFRDFCGQIARISDRYALTQLAILPEAGNQSGNEGDDKVPASALSGTSSELLEVTHPCDVSRGDVVGLLTTTGGRNRQPVRRNIPPNRPQSPLPAGYRVPSGL